MEKSEYLAMEILKEIHNVKSIMKNSTATCDRILDSMENSQESIRKINETVLKIGNKLN